MMGSHREERGRGGKRETIEFCVACYKSPALPSDVASWSEYTAQLAAVLKEGSPCSCWWLAGAEASGSPQLPGSGGQTCKIPGWERWVKEKSKEMKVPAS